MREYRKLDRRSWTQLFLGGGWTCFAGLQDGLLSKLSGQPIWGRFAYQPKQESIENYLKITNGLPLLTVTTSKPDELGSLVGKLALSQAKPLMDYPHALVRQFKVDALWPFLVSLGEKMVKKFPERFQAELEGLIKTSGAKRQDLVAGNTLFDLKQMVLCSGVGVTPAKSVTGGTLLGRNLDYPPVGDIGQYTLIQVYRQGPKYLNFASVGFPGMLGVLSGMNEAGLALAIHEVVDIRSPKRKFNPAGMPYALCYRMILENCQTVEEARRFLLGMERSTTTNLLIADRKQAVVFEVSPDDVLVRPAENGATCCANHYCLPENRAEQQANPYQSFERFQLLEKACGFDQKIDIGLVKKLLDATNLGPNTLQSMIFECDPLRLHLAFGPPPASSGLYRDVDLKPFLKP